MNEHPPTLDIRHASYGKHRVRAMTRFPTDTGESVLDLTLSIDVEGAFLDSYRSGDNRAVLPSDTLRRHALAECRTATADVELLIEAIARRILSANAALTVVTVNAEQRPWQACGHHSFTSLPWTRTATIRVTRGGGVELSSGVNRLQLLLTTGSAFTGFMRDELTTQTDSIDRPLCGTLEASWTSRTSRPTVEAVTQCLVEACSDRPSNAIQQLLTDAGTVVLAQFPQLNTISLRFASLPTSPNHEPSNERSFEIGTGPLGITEVTLASH